MPTRAEADAEIQLVKRRLLRPLSGAQKAAIQAAIAAGDVAAARALDAAARAGATSDFNAIITSLSDYDGALRTYTDPVTGASGTYRAPRYTITDAASEFGIPFAIDEPRLTGNPAQIIRRIDDFSYASISSAYTSGGGPYVSAGGGQSIDATGGVDGGRCFRQAWDANPCGAEDDRVLEGFYNGDVAFASGATEYYQFYYKTSPGFIYGNDGCPTRNGKKHFLLFSTGSGQRWTINPAWGKYIETNGPNVEYVWDSYAPYSEQWAFAHNILGNGQWHRFTYLRDPESSFGAHDGRIATWFDGVKRFERLNFGADPSPMGAIQIFSTFNGGSPQVQSEYIDKLRVWSGAAA